MDGKMERQIDDPIIRKNFEKALCNYLKGVSCDKRKKVYFSISISTIWAFLSGTPQQSQSCAHCDSSQPS